MSDNEVIQKILSIPAETQTVEFKRLSEGKVVDKIVQTIVAMSNTDGGVIVLGVDDPEKSDFSGISRVFGIEENLDVFDSIGRELQRIIPPVSSIWPPDKILVKEAGKTIALIYIPKATDGFRCIDDRVWIRLEKSNKRLTPQEVVKFAYAKGFERADKELVDVPFKLLNTEDYRTWKEHRKIVGDSIEEVLEKTGLARRDKGKLCPTRAAVLLFAEYPTDIMDTKCAVRVLQYSGNTLKFGDAPNLLGTPKTITGPVIKLIKEAHEYVLTLLRAGVRVPSGFVTQYIIPERAIKEALTNAVIHRDYFIKRDIEVKIFEDRVEIESPGLLPFNITPSNIGFVRSEGYRNDVLVKHLREFPFPPNLDQNEGVVAMRTEMKAQNLYPPIFWTYPNLQDGLRVVLINEKVANEWEKVSHYLNQSKYINNEEARKVTGIIQRDKMTKLLKGWVEKGLLIQIVPPSGYVKATRYKLANIADLE